MDIWLPFRHEGPNQIIRIFTRVGELPPPEYDNSNPPPLDKLLGELVEGEWARVPGRPVEDLTADRLKQLAEVTKQFRELLFTESERKAVLSMVEEVVPSLERRRDSGYEGPGEDARGIIDDLLNTLRVPTPFTGRRSTYYW